MCMTFQEYHIMENNTEKVFFHVDKKDKNSGVRSNQ